MSLATPDSRRYSLTAHTAHTAPFHYDVVIAGAGPVGLLLACELRLGGCSVLLLERASDPHSPLKSLPFGLRGLSAPSLDALHRRGLLDAITQAATPGAGQAHWQHAKRRPGGHFAGLQFFHEQIDPTHWPQRLAGPAGPHLASDMARIESVLDARAQALGVDIRRGCAVDALEQADDAIHVGAGDQRFRARWLVGCDGGRSTVRKLAGFGFDGTAPEFTGYSIEAELTDADALSPGRHHTAAGMYTYQAPGIIAMADFDGGAWHRRALTPGHVQAVLRRISGTRVSVSALRQAATWTDRACQADRYRRGRVLLAGDAAHVHSPLGGQGLNLGLGDAMNLGWKLAATVRGDAAGDLLDSYEQERHPVAAQVLDWSRAQVMLMRPDPAARALRAVMRELIDTGDGATFMADRVWGMSLRYDLGPSHPLVGCSMPDFALADGRQAGQCLRDGRGLLLEFAPQASLQPLVARWRLRLQHVVQGAADTLGLSALLVRPDGVVAWAGDASRHDHPALATALERWFGPAGSAPIANDHP